MFAVGVLSWIIFLYALIRGKRAFHAVGPLCRAEVTALDTVVGPRLAGPAFVRLSGAFEDENSSKEDVLGMSIRFRHASDPPEDPRVGDQDLLLGTFRSFLGATKDAKNVNVGDYLGNEYWTVSIWRVVGLAIGEVHAIPPTGQDPTRGANRIARLDADIAAGRAIIRLEMLESHTPIAEVKLTERTALNGNDLRMSMYRRERGIVPTGFRNGVRAVVYPVGQLGRRIRGG
jgi:hypothetical protein